MSETRTAYRPLVGKLGKYPLQRLRVRWKDNIKMDLKRAFCEDRGWSGGTRQRSWLRHYATSRKVVRLSPSEVDFFNLSNPSSLTMALGSTQPLTEMSTRNFLGG
jgi:hypothetical protein